MAAHEHWIDAPIADGTIDANTPAPGVRFTVDARQLSVRPEKGVSEKDRTEVQRNMHGKVLESTAYPEISFRSTQVQRKRDDAWTVSGNVTLHGTTRPVTIEVRLQNDAYTGSTRIRQTDFGIQPITIAGGLVKVKDELDITFRVYTIR